MCACVRVFVKEREEGVDSVNTSLLPAFMCGELSDVVHAYGSVAPESDERLLPLVKHLQREEEGQKQGERRETERKE